MEWTYGIVRQQAMLRQVVFTVALVLNFLNLTLTHGDAIAFTEPAFRMPLKITLGIYLGLHPLLFWLSRRRNPQVAYVLHLSLAVVIIYLMHLVASVPLREILPVLISLNFIAIFAALILLNSRSFVVLTTVITVVDIALCLFVAAQNPDTLFAAAATAGAVVSAALWFIACATSLLMAHHSGALEKNRLALEAHNEQLEAQVTERTRVIEDQQRRLFRSAKMESLGTLAGGIAHDFNNLLMVIQGNTELILHKGEPGPEARAGLEMISHCAESGSNLTRDLLGFARRGKYEVLPLDFSLLVEQIVRIFQRTHKDLPVTLTLAAGLPAIEADATQLEQVVLNLLNNAAQAVREGGSISVTTALQRLAPEDAQRLECTPGDKVCLIVEDTGAGMSAEVRERVFEPFFSSREDGQGTGLGLASAYGIVHSHGGQIEVHSECGKGSTFTIRLPSSDAPPACAPPKPTEHVDGEGQLVLVVDDESALRTTLVSMLEKMHYQVISAASGEEALRLYEARHGELALVLLDVIMPGLSGHQLFERLRAIDAKPRILLVSGFSEMGEAEELLKRGCRGFLQKPFSLEQLSTKVHQVLEVP